MYYVSYGNDVSIHGNGHTYDIEMLDI
jgi:hypothetical protein